MKEWLDRLKGHLPAGLTSSQLDDWLAKHLVGNVQMDGALTHNLVTTAGRRAIASALANPQKSYLGNIVPRFSILRFGASTSTDPPSQEDTTLGGSYSRRIVEQVDPIGEKLVVTNFVGTPEMNFTWRKVGLYLADDTLFSIAQVIEPKTSEMAKTVIWEISWT